MPESFERRPRVQRGSGGRIPSGLRGSPPAFLEVKHQLIGELIERRRALHWTQQQLAEHSGVGQAEISKIERGRKSPTLDTYARLAAALGGAGNRVPTT